MKTLLKIVAGYVAIGVALVYVVLPALTKSKAGTSGFEILGVVAWPLALINIFKRHG